MSSRRRQQQQTGSKAAARPAACSQVRCLQLPCGGGGAAAAAPAPAGRRAPASRDGGNHPVRAPADPCGASHLDAPGARCGLRARAGQATPGGIGRLPPLSCLLLQLLVCSRQSTLIDFPLLPATGESEWEGMCFCGVEIQFAFLLTYRHVCGWLVPCTGGRRSRALRVPRHHAGKALVGYKDLCTTQGIP
jgi:hypothetical protein